MRSMYRRHTDTIFVALDSAQFSVAPPSPHFLIVSSTVLGIEKMSNKYTLNGTENSLPCLGHDARVKNIQIIFNQEFSSENSKCWPNELDVLEQTSEIEKNTQLAREKNGKIAGWSRTCSKFSISFTDQIICSIQSKKYFS